MKHIQHIQHSLEDDLEGMHSSAKEQLSYACHLAGGCYPSELLNARVRNLLVKTFSLELTARSGFGMRQQTMRDRWSRLVQLTAAGPKSLGVFKVNGGLRGLAQELSTDHTTLFRNLKTWEERPYPLVRTDFHLKPDCRSLGWIQIPLLTDWLIWTAEQRAHLGIGQSTDLYRATVVKLTEYMVPMGITPPCEIAGGEVRFLLDVIKKSKKPVSCGAETLEMRIGRLREERRKKFRKIRRKGYEQREARRRLAAVA